MSGFPEEREEEKGREKKKKFEVLFSSVLMAALRVAL